MASRNGELCGYVRFQDRGSGPWRPDIPDAVVSLAVHPRFRQQGVATAMLLTACRTLLEETGVQRIHALVKADNQASLATFRKCRFHETGRTTHGDMPVICFVYPGPGQTQWQNQAQ